MDIFLAFRQIFDGYYKVSLHKREPKMDYFSSEASFSKPPPPQNLTILEGKNHNQDLNKNAQREIEIFNLPW